MYDVHLGLIGKRIVHRGATSKNRLKIGDFAPAAMRLYTINGYSTLIQTWLEENSSITVNSSKMHCTSLHILQFNF